MAKSFEAALQRMAPEAVLIDHITIGYPYYRADLKIRIRKDRRLRLQEEYVLGAITNGLSRTEEILQFLGLEQFVVDQTLAHLLQQTLVRRDESGCLSVTKIGIAALEQHRVSDVAVEPLDVYIDALTGDVHARRGYRLDLGKPPQHRLERIERRPRAIEDFVYYFEHFQQILRVDEENKNSDLLGIDEVSSKVSVDYHCMDLVKYKTSAESDHLLYELFSRGSIDPGFKERIEKLQSCGIHVLEPFFKEDFADADERAEWKDTKQPVTDLSVDHLNHAEALQRTVASLEAKKNQGHLTPKEKQRLESVHDELNRERNTLRAHCVVEIIHTAQIRDQLYTAFNKAQNKLLIVCPWITNSVVNDPFLRHLQKSLKRNIDVKIIYGYKDRQGIDRNSPRALRELNRLAEKFSNLLIIRVSNTHSKILVCDFEFGIVSSFNHLSFRGDDTRTYRDETGALIYDKGAIRQLYEHAEFLENEMLQE